MALALFLALGGCSREEPPEKQSQAAPSPQKAEKKITGPFLFAGLLLNNSPAPSLTTDLPLVLSCVIENPRGNRRLVIPDLSGLKPVVRGGPAGETASVKWEAPGLKNVSLDPKGSVILYWLSTDELKPGDYRIDLKGAESILDAPKDGLAGVRVEQVVFKVVSGSADPKLKAFWRRRVLMLKGDGEAWLAAVEDGLAKDPDNHGLLLERVDALAFNKKPAQAHRALADLIINAEKKLRNKDSKRPVHLPYWYYSYQRRLREEAAEDKAAGEAPVSRQ